MEGKLTTLSLTALAPIAWGSGYYVTQTLLPPDRPVFGAAVRALPAGLVLLVIRPGALSRAWWLRVCVLAIFNFAGFFVLIFVASYRLPGGIASTLTATSPIAIMALAWLLAGERPAALSLAGAAAGLGGVALLVVHGGVRLDVVGVAASLGAVGISSAGYAWVKIWQPPHDLVTFTGWQLLVAGVILLPAALIVEGPPPQFDLRASAGYAYVGLIGTALAFLVWFRGLRRLPASAVGLIGLLNPLTGTVLGASLAGEMLTTQRLVGVGLVLSGAVLGQPSVLERIGVRLQTPSTGLIRSEVPHRPPEGVTDDLAHIDPRGTATAGCRRS